MNKFYAVVRGRRPGIYGQWAGKNGAQEQTDGYANARYKGFNRLEDALNWYSEHTGTQAKLFGISSDYQPGVDDFSSAAPKSIASIPEDTVLIYTDGASLGNPGPGGYGIVLISKKSRRELSAGFRRTTNNRMELMACIQGLRALKKTARVLLFSDSRYVINGVTKGWAKRWRRNGWMRSDTEPAENSDLWGDLLDLLERHEVEFHWVRGHAGTPENERCDELAVRAAHRPNLPADEGYESQRPRRVSPPNRRTKKE
jgi:ribonuclease HI